jgi:RimJ/RimL family protein N-acetyltransferase
MADFPVNPLLPDAVLRKQAELPLKPAPVTLAGGIVRLEPLDIARDVEALFAVSNGQQAALGERSVDAYDADALIWRYMSGGPFESAAALGLWLQAQIDAPNMLPLCVFDAKADAPVGVATFMNNFPQHLKIELGGIWYSPLAQGTGANTEATYLMLKHAFALGYRRVEWKCDALNTRSRKAALRLGFQFEGIQEYHFVVKGRNRDTAWFRILDREWDGVRSRFEDMLRA